MRQVIPFYKEIVFKTNIANIISISLEHTESIGDGEVNGEFTVFGEYKIHADTTEKESFKYKLPFTAIVPDNIDINSVVVDIVDFTYDQIENDVLKVNIDFSIVGDEVVIPKVVDDYEIERNIEDILSPRNDEVLIPVDNIETLEEVNMVQENIEKEETVIVSDNDEYVTYHVHVVGVNETIESITKLYNANLELLKDYNDISKVNIGDKILVPEYVRE